MDPVTASVIAQEAAPIMRQGAQMQMQWWKDNAIWVVLTFLVIIGAIIGIVMWRK